MRPTPNSRLLHTQLKYSFFNNRNWTLPIISKQPPCLTSFTLFTNNDKNSSTAAMPVPKPHVLDLTSLIPTKEAQIQIWTTQYRYGELEAAELERLLRKRLRFAEVKAIVVANMGAPAGECSRDALLSKIVNFMDVGVDAADTEEAVTKIKKRPAAAIDDPEEKSDKEIPLKKIRTM